MKNKIPYFKKAVFSFALLICLFSCVNVQRVYAQSWTESAGLDSTAIYSSDYQSQDRPETSPEEKEKPGAAEKWISGVFTSAADGLDRLFSSMNANLDYIVCGRVGSNSADVAYFTFELKAGNPYGTISALAYSGLRGITYVVLTCIILYKLVRYLYSKGNGQARERLKDTLVTFTIIYSLLYLMPYILDMALFIRDCFVYYVLTKLSSNVSGNLGLVEAFRQSASKGFITDAIMYFGAELITLVFIFEYAGMAMAMVIMFILFPFVSMQANFDKSILSSWIKNVYSTIITPIFDIVLLMIPVLMSTLYPDADLLKLVLCAMVIPSRRIAKQVLGLTSVGEGLMSTMTAMAAVKSIAGLAKGTMHKGAEIANSIKNGHEDLKNAKRENAMAEAEHADAEELAEIDKEKMNDYNWTDTEAFGVSGRGGYKVNKGEESLNQREFEKNGFGIAGEENEKLDNTPDLDESEGMVGADAETRTESVNPVKDTDDEDVGAFSVEGIPSMEKAGAGDHLDDKENPYIDYDNMDTRMNNIGEDGTVETPYGLTDLSNRLNKEKSLLQEDNAEHEASIAELQQDKAELAQENAELEEKSASQDFDYGEAKQQIRANKTKMAGLDVQIAKHKNAIAGNNTRIKSIDSQLKDTKEMEDVVSGTGKTTSREELGMSASSHGRSNGAGMSARQQEVLEKFADVNNFESAAYANLSHQKKEQLYRKRAHQQFRNAAFQTVGSLAGGAVMGSVGYAASMYSGSAMMSMVTSSMANAGVSYGGNVLEGTTRIAAAPTIMAGKAVGKQVSNLASLHTASTISRIAASLKQPTVTVQGKGTGPYTVKAGDGGSPKILSPDMKVTSPNNIEVMSPGDMEVLLPETNYSVRTATPPTIQVSTGKPGAAYMLADKSEQVEYELLGESFENMKINSRDLEIYTYIHNEGATVMQDVLVAATTPGSKLQANMDVAVENLMQQDTYRKLDELGRQRMVNEQRANVLKNELMLQIRTSIPRNDVDNTISSEAQEYIENTISKAVDDFLKKSPYSL